MEVAGGVVTVTASTAYGRMPGTLRIDADHYVILETGEVREMEHGDKRTDNLHSLRRSMATLRGLINANFGGDAEALKSQAWLTLTYRENVRDAARVGRDWQAFIRWVRTETGAPLEYIAVIEPQRRGAWHLHVMLLRTDGGELYVPQARLLAAWRKVAARETPPEKLTGGKTSGGLHIHRLEGIDNLGAYLSAYLCDEDGAKGERLHLYPTGLHFYRPSKGIKRPTMEEYATLEDAMEAAAALTGAEAHYDAAARIVDDDGRAVQHSRTIQYKRRT